MKALVYENYAQNDDFESILQIKDIPEPTPKPNDVIFRVKAAALNYDDIWGMRGKPLAVPLPHISGTDAAGEVIAIGDNVKNIKVGDRIVSHGNMSCASVQHVPMAGNMIAGNEKFGDLKLDHFGVVTVKLHTFQKLTS